MVISLASKTFSTSKLVRPLAFFFFKMFVRQSCMILTRKRLPVDIFLTDYLSKSLAFYEFSSTNLSPGKENYT